MASASQILPLLSSQIDKIRNVCILAHVDHGKTSLADALLATNGIISFRQVGKLRFMDSLEAEQVRGITMKSSAVGLFYNPCVQMGRQFSPDAAADDPNSYLINLIDSPGHVDFASDVSTAVRLCDCAMIVVDVVEGVCPQTRAVIQQAWNERLTLILVLNKIDRLFLQLGLSSIQVYDRILRVLEQVNSVLAEMFTADVIQQTRDNTDDDSSTTRSAVGTYTWSSGLEATDDSQVYFSPDRANVLFTSVVDGWGFRISDFADLWSNRMNLPKKGLLKALWGDYYFVPSRDGGPPRVKPNARAKNKKPIFVQLVIDNLHFIYKTLIVNDNRDMASHIADRLGIKLDPRLLQQNVDSRSLLGSILTHWHPLGPAMFRTIVDICPSPLTAINHERALYMLFGEISTTKAGLEEEAVISDACESAMHPISEKVELVDGLSLDNNGVECNEDEIESTAFPAINALKACSSESDAPVIIFVSKVFWTEKRRNTSTIVFPKDASRLNPLSKSTDVQSMKKESLKATRFATTNRYIIPDSKTATVPANSATDLIFDKEFVALSRIYSGRVRIGQRLFVLGPKFDGSNIPKCLLDADPAHLPLGSVRIPEMEDDDLSLFKSRRRSSSTSSCSSNSSNLSGSFCTNSVSGSGLHEDQVLRHVYVGEITDVLQFCGGQNNAFHLSDPACPIDSFSAGNVVGLMGASLISSLPKSGLLVSSLRLVASPEARRVLPLAGLAIWHGAPVVSLAIEPASAADPNDMVRLEKGLRLLERSDPCAEVTFSPRGEYLLHAAGEIHMQKCLEDLTVHFAPDLEFHTSPFVVPFRETVTEACPPASYVRFDSLAFAKAQLEQELRQKHLVYHETHENCVHFCTTVEEGTSLQPQNRQPETFKEISDPTQYLPLGMLQLPYSKSRTRVFIRVTAYPLPDNILAWLETRAATYINVLLRAIKHKLSSSRRAIACLKMFEDEFSAQLDAVPPEYCAFLDWRSLKGRLLCLGPQQVGPNLLFSRLRSGLFRLDTAWGKPVPPWSDEAPSGTGTGTAATDEMSEDCTPQIPLLSYGKAILRGFQMATEQGPLCAEPMRGVAFVLEEIFAEDRIQLPTPRILNSADLTKSEGNIENSVEINAHGEEDKEVSPEATNNETGDSDPILAALRAKQAIIHKRKQGDPISSMSWLNLDADDDYNEDSENDCPDDDGDWYNDGDNNEHRNQVEEKKTERVGPEDEGEHVVEPEKKLTLNDYFYWQRRRDNGWLPDVTPGLLTSAMARACISAFMACPAQRLVLSMYDIEVQCRGDVLGRMYAVLRKRYSRVVREDLQEGGECFVIHARLPVVESFGLTDDLRKRTSGLVSLPQLRPGGWEVLDIDPLQRDSSGRIAILGETHIKIWQRQQEAIKHLRMSERDTTSKIDDASSLSGSGVTAAGRAPSSVLDSDAEVDGELTQDENDKQLMRLRAYLREVRKRKGLSLHEQLVISADKQRTLKKNK